jgi:hypothetical protein
VRTPPTATPVAALPEQLAIITEPSGLAGAYRATREVAVVWVRTQPRLAAVLDGCSWGWTLADAGGRGLHGKGGINVVGLCSAESLRRYGGVYPDIDKVAMQEL